MNHEIINNELSEDTKLLISKVESIEEELTKKEQEINDKKEELSKKDKEIEELKNEIALLKGVISTSNRKIFDKSSEQVDSNQLSLFNEAEKYSDSKVEEVITEEITYSRAKKTNTSKKDNLANLETVIIEHKLEGEDLKCNDCDEELTEIGVKSEKIIIKYVPAKLIAEKHIMYSYACKTCEKETGESNIISTAAPKSVFYNSMASNELVAHTVALKYQHAMPLYRQQAYRKMSSELTYYY
ncbi:IS66 family transposase zinc-finger binding domain-containing protein [Clostridium gasigenes]|uniref:IS66 family transposase zinc-finger binding domain-containing protein n=1 Tax=Clostridium gasigenes TaxID=94869 RepID=UPI0014382A67|nr:IS66 family transposase zinc-finger binding domain-containing protein [Clostridium gasigenes]NKF08856.1 hypothetical protein [Clostridium gasigenes]QSW21263.1 IS66 family transposase zinc-finger binding domain-containing protein [Clostridium gasigenes]